jgi:predicted amidophosphoribosyltransferase
MEWVAPYWAVVGVLLVLPAAWVVGKLRRRRRIVGVCRTCGYDLRASRERCPECGMAIETRAV